MKRLSPFLREVELAKDQYLFHQGEPLTDLYFPTTAVVSEFQMLEDGRTIEVALIARNGLAGAQSILSSDPAINSVQTAIAGRAIKLNLKYLTPDIAADSIFQRQLSAYLETHFKGLSQKLVCTSYHSVEQRFCTQLLRIADLTGEDRFEVTHDHVARSLGTHRPSITAIAQVLRDKGLFEYSRGRVRIIDRQGMQELACSCYLPELPRVRLQANGQSAAEE